MEEKDIIITMKGAAWNVVMNALASRPYGEVAAVIADIQRQAAPQVTESQAANVASAASEG